MPATNTNPQLGGAFDPSKDVTLVGAFEASGKVVSYGTAGVGYSTGAGSTVTQITSKSTAVTLNVPCGAITMNNAALNTVTGVAFTINNSLVAATDVIIANLKSGNSASSYTLTVDTVAAGSFKLSLYNFTGGNLSEAVVINFAVIKGVTS